MYHPDLAFDRTALAMTASLLAACGPGDPGSQAPMGAPASFSPAQQVVRDDGRVAHCNTVHSFTLPTRMVEKLDVSVGPDTAVISCVLQAVENGAVRVLPAQVRGTATALSGNTRQLEFQEVQEEDTRSYVASFTIDARVGIRFDVSILDPQTGATYQVDFEQTRL